MAKRPIIRWKSLDELKPNPVLMGDAAKPRKRRAAPEMDYQKVQVEYLRRQFPRYVVAKVENETSAAIGATKGARARYGAMRIESGLHPGFPDIQMWCEFPVVILFENKSKDGVLSENQIETIAKLKALGWQVHVSRTIEDAQQHLRERGLLR